MIFDYKIGDAVMLSNGRKAIITGYGIYDNQYWCEVAGGDGINLGSADYFATYGQEPIISTVLDAHEARALSLSLLRECQKYGDWLLKERFTPVAHLIHQQRNTD